MKALIFERPHPQKTKIKEKWQKNKHSFQGDWAPSIHDKFKGKEEHIHNSWSEDFHNKKHKKEKHKHQ